jgi:hypothetical protein
MLRARSLCHRIAVPDGFLATRVARMPGSSSTRCDVCASRIHVEANGASRTQKG